MFLKILQNRREIEYLSLVVQKCNIGMTELNYIPTRNLPRTISFCIQNTQVSGENLCFRHRPHQMSDITQWESLPLSSDGILKVPDIDQLELLILF